MKVPRIFRRIIISLVAYLILCAIAGIVVAEVTLHPSRRQLSPDSLANLHQYAFESDSQTQNATIIARDGTPLRGWLVTPQHNNGDAVILLHGMSDNRLGMSGAAQMLEHHGYSLLMPDARAHGESGGALATFGLLERDDIYRWYVWLRTQ